MDDRVSRVRLSDRAKNILVDKLEPLIKQTTIRKNVNRVNSGMGRSQVFGYGARRQRGFGEFANNKRYPELYNILLQFGRAVVPSFIPWTAIQVNHNYQTKPHIDKNNIGRSLNVSFGDFTGGELVIDGKAYQTKLHPLVFNGAFKEHYNHKINGDRYSLVYFVSAPPNSTDKHIEDLHSKLMNSIKTGGSIETDLFETEGKVSLPEFSNMEIVVPTYMYKKLPKLKDGKEPTYKYRLTLPISSARHLSSRGGLTSIQLHQKPVGDIVVFEEKKEDDEKPNLYDFSPKDQAKIRAYYKSVKDSDHLEPNDVAKDKFEIVKRGLPCYLYKNCNLKNMKTDRAKVKPPPKPRGRPKKTLAVAEVPKEEEEEDDDVSIEITPKPKPAPKPKPVAKAGGKPKGRPKKEPKQMVLVPEWSPSEDLFNLQLSADMDKPVDDKWVYNKKKAGAKAVVIDEDTGENILSSKKAQFVLPKGDEAVKNPNKKTGRPAKLDADEFDFEDIDKFIKDKKAGKGIKNIISPNNKMVNSWISYVKDYASKKGIKYNDALKDPACKAGYKKGGGEGTKASHSIGGGAIGKGDLIHIDLGSHNGKNYKMGEGITKQDGHYAVMAPKVGWGVVNELGNHQAFLGRATQLGANAGKTYINFNP